MEDIVDTFRPKIQALYDKYFSIEKYKIENQVYVYKKWKDDEFDIEEKNIKKRYEALRKFYKDRNSLIFHERDLEKNMEMELFRNNVNRNKKRISIEESFAIELANINMTESERDVANAKRALDKKLADFKRYTSDVNEVAKVSTNLKAKLYLNDAAAYKSSLNALKELKSGYGEGDSLGKVFADMNKDLPGVKALYDDIGKMKPIDMTPFYIDLSKAKIELKAAVNAAKISGQEVADVEEFYQSKIAGIYTKYYKLRETSIKNSVRYYATWKDDEFQIEEMNARERYLAMVDYLEKTHASKQKFLDLDIAHGAELQRILQAQDKKKFEMKNKLDEEYELSHSLMINRSFEESLLALKKEMKQYELYTDDKMKYDAVYFEKKKQLLRRKG